MTRPRMVEVDAKCRIANSHHERRAMEIHGVLAARLGVSNFEWWCPGWGCRCQRGCLVYVSGLRMSNPAMNCPVFSGGRSPRQRCCRRCSDSRAVLNQRSRGL